MLKDTILHIGLPKTGTTFLQNEIFPKLDGVEVYGTGMYSKDYDHTTKFPDDKTILITKESISSIRRTKDRADRFTVIKRINREFPDAKVIVVFREINGWTRSIYSQYIRDGGVLEFDAFSKMINELNPDMSDYKKYESLLRELFSDVLVLWHKDLKENSTLFVDKICKFIGTNTPTFNTGRRSNISLDKKAIERWRRINRFFKSYYNPKGYFPRKYNPTAWFYRLELKYNQFFHFTHQLLF